MNGHIVYENTNTSSTFNNVSFSAGFTWHINENNSLLFSLGRGVRSPDMTERFIILLPVSYDPYDYLGNPQLKPEINYEADLGYNLIHKKAGSVSFSVFYSYVKNYILGEMVPPSEVPPQTRGVLGVKRFVNIDNARLSGFELSYASPVSYPWFLRFNAAYTFGINPEAVQYVRENGEVVGEEIIENDPLNEIPPLEANLMFGYGFFNKKLVPELDFRMVAAQNKVSVANYEQITPGFMTVDFILTYHYSEYLSVYTGITNLTNTNYYEHLNRRIIGSKSPLLEPGRMFYLNLSFKL
jgi:iron complex outermembrane receptor protein